MEVQAFDDRRVGEHEQVELGVGLTATTAPRTGRRRGRRGRRRGCASPSRMWPAPSNTWKTRDPTSRRGGVRAGPQPVELGADGRHDVTAGGRVGVADRGVPGLDRRRVPLVLERELLAQRGVGVLPAVGRDR